MDYVFDGGMKPLGSSGFTTRFTSTSSATLGDDHFYFQAGNMRGSWGPIWGDNAILSPYARQAGQFSYVYRGQGITVTEALFALAATDSSGQSLPLPNKFLALHGMDLYPTSWLTIGLFEAMVWRGRMETLYLLPFTLYYYVQGLAGFYDNSFIGFTTSLKLPSSTRWDTILFVDDLSVNDLFRFNFTGKTKLSLQSNLGWTPHLPWLEKTAVDFLIVTPYTYTHSDDKGDLVTDPPTPNYLDYTNSGSGLGPSVPPNTLRLEWSALVRPSPEAEIEGFTRLILHGNSGESYGGNGGLFDNGFAAKAYESLNFLNQKVLEKTVHWGAKWKSKLDGPFGSSFAELGYTLELRWNGELGAGDKKLAHYLRVIVRQQL